MKPETASKPQNGLGERCTVHGHFTVTHFTALCQSQAVLCCAELS